MLHSSTRVGAAGAPESGKAVGDLNRQLDICQVPNLTDQHRLLITSQLAGDVALRTRKNYRPGPLGYSELRVSVRCQSEDQAHSAGGCGAPTAALRSYKLLDVSACSPARFRVAS